MEMKVKVMDVDGESEVTTEQHLNNNKSDHRGLPNNMTCHQQHMTMMMGADVDGCIDAMHQMILFFVC